jgi:hypothetical protein
VPLPGVGSDETRPVCEPTFTGATGGEIVEQLVEILFRQIFVIVVVDLHHRRIAAGAEALDFEPRERAVGRDVLLRPMRASRILRSSGAPFTWHGGVPQSWMKCRPTGARLNIV